jgi:microcompartment protein CcmL/EutN
MMFFDAGAAQTWTIGILTTFLVINRIHGDVKLAVRLQFASVLESCAEKAQETDETSINPLRVLKK